MNMEKYEERTHKNWWEAVKYARNHPRFLLIVSITTILFGLGVMVIGLYFKTEIAYMVSLGVFVSFVFMAVTILTITAISQDLRLKKHGRQVKRRP